MRKRLLLAFFSLQFLTVIKSQDLLSVNNLSIEVGIGYNTLYWDAITTREELNNNRNQFILLPSCKVKYSIPLVKINNTTSFGLTPFVGYNNFGGKSETNSGGYKDKVLLQSFQIGILPSYSFQNYTIYGGIRKQYIFSAKNQSFGFALDPIESEREWSTEDFQRFFNNSTHNIGAGINYRIKRFTLGFEAWLGINDISAIKDQEIGSGDFSDIVNVFIYNDQYSFVISFTL